jgi:hypothetical protein
LPCSSFRSHALPDVGPHPRRCVAEPSSSVGGKPLGGGEAGLLGVSVCADPGGGRSLRSARHADTDVAGCRPGRRPKPLSGLARGSRVTARTRTARVELHRILGRGLGFGASSWRFVRPKPELPLRSSPLVGHDRGRACPPGHSRVSGSLAASPKRGGLLAVLPKAASHLRFTEVSRGCKTRSVGYGRLLPWGSVPFGVSVRAIVVSVCLTDTIRSRGFSPSQRFEPAWTSWLCFAPHPPLGFGNGLRSFSHSASRDASRRPLLSCRFGWLGHLSSKLELYLRPCLPLHLATLR